MDQEQLDVLTQQKIDLIVSMKTKKFDEEIKNLKDVIGNLQADIMQLRREMAQKPTQTTSQVEIKPVVERQERKEEPRHTEEKKETKKEESQGSHPRQGNYTSDDVSIEKYFNFSRK
ncbi:hypothetical protein GF342_01845 [Candidatus Woesearchaeota archaeon]|nr:hypothetical protein [Candidatus Woesearchaeota archaeon]